MKKILSALLCMVMLLTPMMALAASPAEMLDAAWQAGRSQKVEVSLSLNEDLLKEMGDDELDGAIGDLLDVTSLVFVAGQQGPWKAGVNIDGTEVVSLQGETVGDTHYLGSQILGPKPLAATNDDLLSLVNFFVDMMVKEGEISSSDAMQMKAIIAMLPQLIAEMENMEPVEIDFTLVEQAEAALAARVETINPFTVDGIDAPATCQYIRMTADDVTRLYLAFVNSLAPIFKGTDMEDVFTEMLTVGEELYNFITSTGCDVCVAVMQDEHHNTVYAGFWFVPTEIPGTTFAVAYRANTILKGEYKRLTVNGCETHTAQLTAVNGEETIVVTALVDVENEAEQKASIRMEANFTDEKAMFELKWEQKNNYGAVATEHGVISMTEWSEYKGHGTGTEIAMEYDVIGRMNGKDAEVVTTVTLKGNGMEAGTVTIKTTTGEPLPTLAGGSDVRIVPMIINANFDNPNDPLNEYVMSLSDNLMTTMMLLMQKLPMSVLMLMM